MTTDLELLEGWRSGRIEAGDALFDRHFDALYRFFGNKVTDGIDDLVQQTWEAMVNARETFRGDSTFRTYLFATARNVLFKQFERRSRDAARFAQDQTSIVDLGESPSRVVLARAEQRVLALALQRIPVDYQIALELYYWEDMSAPELAATLGLTEPAVRSRLRRALELLRKVLPEVAASPQESQSVSVDLEKWAASLQD